MFRARLMETRLLAIESSCDESAVAVFDPDRGITGDWIHSQVALHGGYGGVVPDLASREHLKNLPALIGRLRESGLGPRDAGAVVVTRGPGLAGCLALGIATAKALALAWGLPLAGVNHLRGHLFSPFIGLHAEAPPAFRGNFAALLPHLGLLVSGGNTLLVELSAGGRVEILSQTVDDAAGEAFDKGAKLLGLPYPGGALVEKLAAGGDPRRFVFPKGIADKEDPRFSFSGLKTSLRHRLESLGARESEAAMADICAGYQEAIVAQLAGRTRAWLRRRRFASVGLSGGVANNGALRARIAAIAAGAGLPFLAAQPRHSGDNAAMIAFAAFADEAFPAPAFDNWAMSFQPSLAIDRP
jgi:N6-L-threonylcarbamoyladenine synthase